MQVLLVGGPRDGTVFAVPPGVTRVEVRRHGSRHLADQYDKDLRWRSADPVPFHYVGTKEVIDGHD